MNINCYLNFEKMLALNYKKIGLSDDEYLLLNITYQLVQTGTNFVNPEDLALLCNFTTTKIDVVYSGLISKKLISNEINDNRILYTSFDGIYKKLWEVLNGTEVKKANVEVVEEDIFKYMQTFFDRPLSPLEYDVIQSWKNKKYDYNLIKASCELAAQCGNKSIRYIDTIIFEENKRLEMGDEEYQKRQQETIELSTVDWLNK